MAINLPRSRWSTAPNAEASPSPSATPPLATTPESTAEPSLDTDTEILPCPECPERKVALLGYIGPDTRVTGDGVTPYRVHAFDWAVTIPDGITAVGGYAYINGAVTVPIHFPDMDSALHFYAWGSERGRTSGSPEAQAILDEVVASLAYLNHGEGHCWYEGGQIYLTIWQGPPSRGNNDFLSLGKPEEIGPDLYDMGDVTTTRIIDKGYVEGGFRVGEARLVILPPMGPGCGQMPRESRE